MILLVLSLFSLIANADNGAKTFQAEKAIAKSERSAILHLKKLLIRYKGHPKEPGLTVRLAELYTRRSKSSRFFEFNQKLNNYSPKEVTNLRSRRYIEKAISNYELYLKRFPKDRRYDTVLFNSAFSMQQLGKTPLARSRYQKLVTHFPQSKHYQNAVLAIAEIDYNKAKFRSAISYYKKILETAETYPYATYKSAWSYYNMQNTESAIGLLEKVLEVEKNSRFSLRSEALRDLALFFADVRAPEQAYNYFRGLTNKEELGTVLLQLVKIYEAHGKSKQISPLLTQFLKGHPDSPMWPTIKGKLVSVHLAKKSIAQAYKNFEQLTVHCDQKITEQCPTSVKANAKQLIRSKQTKSSQKIFAFEKLLQHEEESEKRKNVHIAYADTLAAMKLYRDSAVQYLNASAYESKQAAKEPLYKSGLENLFQAAHPNWTATEIDGFSPHLTVYLKGYSPVDPPIAYNFATVLNKNERYALAIPLFQYLAQNKTSRLALVQDGHLFSLEKLGRYPEAAKLAKSWLASTSEANRKRKLNRQLEHFQLMALQDNVPALLEFARGKSSQKSRSTALLKAINKKREQKAPVETAKLMLEFATAFPKDPVARPLLEESIGLFSQAGEITMSALAVEQLSLQKMKLTEKSYWLLQLANYKRMLNEPANPVYQQVLELDQPGDRSSAAHQLYLSGDEQQLKRLLSWKEEPYFSLSWAHAAKNAFEKGQLSDAFSLSAKVLRHSQHSLSKAQVRLVQAKVLIEEFRRQSTKSRAARLEKVISLKTQRFLKAQKALQAVESYGQADVSISAMDLTITLIEEFAASLKAFPQPKGITAKEFEPIQKVLAEQANSIMKETEKVSDKIKLLLYSHNITNWDVISRHSLFYKSADLTFQSAKGLANE